MIGFYLTTTGEYSPVQIEDISNSIILDDRNKTFKVMNQYVFDFQKLSADYDTLTADSSREGLSIYGANAMFDGLNGKISTTESSVNTLEGWKAVVDASIDTIDSSINALEEWKIVVDTSISDINSSISSIKTDYISNASMGVNGGVATLDASGRVPSSQLPSYVDDIIEGYLHDGVFYEDAEYLHAITGEGGKIYVDLPTNTSWRWGGSAYTQVSKSLALGETEGTAYEGSKGKALKDAFDLHESSAAIHITADERTAWNNASDNSHTHDNKNVLDSITAGDITNFIDASNAKHTHTNAGILDGLTDTSISDWNTAYGWGNHANAGYAQQSYAADVSSRLATVNTTLTTRVQNVSTYAINVSTYATDVSSRLATVNTTLTGRIVDVSAYAIDVSTYAANVSTNHANDVSAFNAHFAKVDASLLHHDSSIAELYDNTYELTQVWAAAWYDISTHLELTDSSLDAHASNPTVHITAAERTAWADASAKKHEHSNKIVLDGITDSSFHTHTNKSVIDAISSTDVTNWNNASDNSHSHTNKTVLDGITSTDVANWIDASNNQHTHSNSDILNGFTDASIADFIRDTSYDLGDVDELIAGTSTTPKVWDASVINAYIAVLAANAVIFKGGIDASTGQIDDTSETLTTVANEKGDVYVVTSEGTLCGVDMRVGDSIIFKTNVGTNVAPQPEQLTFVLGTVKVTNMNATLQWSQLTKIANVEGIDISVALPADPAIELVPRIEDISAYAIEVSSYAANVSVNLANDVSIINSHFSNVDSSLVHHDSSLYEIYDNLYELTQVWSAAWYDISTHLSTTDSSLNEHIVETTGVGAFADVPANPYIGQTYFAIDVSVAGVGNEGIPIWYNGTNWVDALGRTVS